MVTDATDFVSIGYAPRTVKAAAQTARAEGAGEGASQASPTPLLGQKGSSPHDNPTSDHLRRRAPAARRERGHASRSRRFDLSDQGHPAEHPPALGGHGYGHRSQACHRDGAGRRDRRHSPQPVCRTAGRRSRHGQEIRKRRGDEPRHHRTDRHAGRVARAQAAHAFLRHSGCREKRQGRRHRHQPRHALCRRREREGREPDDARNRHREDGHAHRGSPPPAPQAPDRTPRDR